MQPFRDSSGTFKKCPRHSSAAGFWAKIKKILAAGVLVPAAGKGMGKGRKKTKGGGMFI